MDDKENINSSPSQSNDNNSSSSNDNNSTTSSVPQVDVADSNTFTDNKGFGKQSPEIEKKGG
jgi:hypothetical protein